MSRVKGVMLGLPVVVGLATGAASAQSFDCAKAMHPDEKAVCADRTLGDLDVRMATLWWVLNEAPMMMGARGALKDDQKAFLDRRAACRADTACLTAAYKGRIAAMEQQVTALMQRYCKAIQLC